MLLLSLAIAASMSEPQTHPQLGWGEYISKLHPGESKLASLCFLFHGLPQGVFGSRFEYDTEEQLRDEVYMAGILEAPTKSQIVLHDCAEFVASRMYVDGKGKPYLLLGANDAWFYTDSLQSDHTSKSSIRDVLLREALLTYLSLDDYPMRRLPKSLWPPSKDASRELVRKNVLRLCKVLTLTNQLHADWTHPGPWR